MKIISIYVAVTLCLVVVKCDNWLGNLGSDAKNDEHHEKPQKLSTPKECARECKKGEEPLTCYYHFTIEYYATMSQACDLCRSNSTTGLTPDCQCITADGYETSGIIVANRQYPGPSIMVCENDSVVIDVRNEVPGNGITLHWHGIFQKDHQYYDGVPYVTQCPIAEATTFRYQWIARNAGTHFWHSHSGLHKSDGLEGALIVRHPKCDAPHQIWDEDRLEHFIFIGDWFHSSAEEHFPGNVVREPGQLPDNFLINGKGQWTDPVTGNVTTTPLAVYTVKAGKRYRFRIINSCGLKCGVQMTIQKHNLTVIATDGIYVKPVNVTSIESLSAERYDFILDANQKSASYWIQFRGTGDCEAKRLQQLAILRYEEAPSEPEDKRPSYVEGLLAGIILNPFNVRCNGSPDSANAVCVKNLKNATPIPSRVLQREPDMRIFMPVNFHRYALEDIFKVGTYDRFVVGGPVPAIATVGGISNVLVGSPLLSQRKDIPDSQICSNADAPVKCNGTVPCKCSHIEDIPLDAVVEFVLVDEDNSPTTSHPFHTHGHFFYVMGEARAEDFGVEKMTLDIAKILHGRDLIEMNYDRPPSKDTYGVPSKGIIIIRMVADNPGYWLFHCHFVFHLEMGMSLVMHVGEDKDLPPIPKDFPTCENFVPSVNNLGKN